MSRIAQVAPPFARARSQGCGSTDRVIAELTNELVRRGHEVTVFADGDPATTASLAGSGPGTGSPAVSGGDTTRAIARTVRAVLRRAGEFDIIHSHLEWAGLALRAGGRPLVTTFHRPVDRVQPIGPLRLRDAGAFVALTHAQAGLGPWIPWSAVIPNGLPLDPLPFSSVRGEHMCYLGPADDEVGLLDAIEVARLSGCRLRVAAPSGTPPAQRRHFEAVVGPALERADVEYLGELDERGRNELLASSLASLVPASSSEPFGLVAIESLACGTPVLGRPAGALPEIVRDGADGFLRGTPAQLAAAVARLPELDRGAIRAATIDRYHVRRMADGYEALYATVRSRHSARAQPGRRAGRRQAEPRGREARPPSGPPHAATTSAARPRHPRELTV